MQIKRANEYGFCFGVKRAIKLAEQNKNAITIGPLIHNQKEIDRLKVNFNVHVETNLDNIKENSNVIIRTHGIQKNDLERLKQSNVNIIDATCPFVTKPQKICEQMSDEGYHIIIFGDKDHPEVKGVASYCTKAYQVVLDKDHIDINIIKNKVALVSQTTKNLSKFLEIANYLIEICSEVRVFNTICNATFANQEAVKELAIDSDVVIVVGGKQSSNTKQLLNISLNYCKDSYCIEDENELQKEWFVGKQKCGITAGASTPDWIINSVENKIREFQEK
ncbi:4-hydroxy-3-methylbut-2-enyl diphosphate reductase [Helicobacter sp. MIT 99-5507]|uniref:4-hydroxy-3-methylbut-2-enyl diphosphate reductase n=1 Tax=Helicobacter sp. MIT 99-5507 TaxID=152489 RepID=UPI000E1F317C|nr:4-hydroxy-3-methylbut-2-enyl diphosphate reductase [Helicobacter sp. MIT 99-5507]RDU57295.1 4-hydroxy-3-methylbut-2-enyl diphosphate reductase [Helicobacter sp. MIT 99-5507]